MEELRIQGCTVTGGMVVTHPETSSHYPKACMETSYLLLCHKLGEGGKFC